MTYKWQGKTYDTAHMKSFSTGNPAMPFIYVAPDEGGVFVVRIDRLDGVEVRLADPVEIRALAERYHIPELLLVQGEKKPTEGGSQKVASQWHVLIVEDDGASRHALGRLLKLSGYEISSAATLSEAEEKLNCRPRCLILDLNLPDGMGTSLLQKVRDRKLPIKVAITTATTDSRLLAAASELCPDAIFMKPLDLGEVAQWLDAA